MQPIIMQDWITIRGSASNNVIQSQSAWLLTAPFQDITFYIDVREMTSTPQFQFETAPSRDEVLFVRMGAAFAPTVGSTVVKNYYAANADAPVSHWARWKLVAPAVTPWDLSFRIMAVGNAPC